MDRSSSESNSRSCHDDVSITVDLVAAARNHLSFLRLISDSTLLHHRPTLLRSLRRYHHQWMPLMAGVSSTSTPPFLILPPLDTQWIWHCHCLHPAKYIDYCVSRFGFVVEKPAIFDEATEDYAYCRCREIWTSTYPCEPFDLMETAQVSDDMDCEDRELLEMVEDRRDVCSLFSDVFFSESVFLVSARRRYNCFLRLSEKLKRRDYRFVPASDILLMWQVHQSFPVAYKKDMDKMGLSDDLDRIVVGNCDKAKDEEVEKTRRAWEEEFDEPLERSGSCLRPSSSPSRIFLYWEGSDDDVNRRYKPLRPRSLLQVLVFVKGRWDEGKGGRNNKKTFLRLQTLRCHSEMKLSKLISSLSSESWRRSWQLYCEFGTRGVILRLRKQGSGCLRNRTIETLVFEWNDLLRQRMLSLSKDLGMQLKILVSVTPPVQAPYLLKCLPDRVTDDGGTMISDVILRMNGYHPQKGRWLSRTVIDQFKRECFVIRIRIAEGFWRRGAETPRAVKWENQVIEIHEGPWSYVAGSVGNAPKKVVGSATPREKNTQERKITWSLSTGDLLTIRWGGGLEFQLENEESHGMVRLLKGRKLQYQVNNSSGSNFEQQEEQFLTLVRFMPENPNGKATALINWRLFAVEFLPEEDAVLVLLLCTIVVRTISEVKREDVGRLLLRKRVNEGKAGARDWGSVMVPGSPSPHLNPWFWNADKVLTKAEVNDTRQPSYWYSAADGKDDMYKEALLGPFLVS